MNPDAIEFGREDTVKFEPKCRPSWSCAILAICLLSGLPGLVPVAAAAPSLRLVLPQGPAPLPLEDVPVVAFPALNLAVLASEDAATEAAGGPMRFAVPHPVLITPDTHGQWRQMPGDPDQRVWRLRIKAAGASSLNLAFTRYRMPEGAQLLVYATDRTYALRPFGAADNKDHGELWTPVVLSDDIVIEVQVPEADASAVDLALTAVNHGYRGFGRSAAPAQKSGSCNVDTVCPEGNAWSNQIRSVARIVIAGSALCSGALINNTAQDLTPYFLTADHCGISTGNDQTVVVYWNYQNSTCRTPGSPQSGGPGNGSLAQNQVGSIFRAGNGATDFTLVELEDPPSPAFNVFWAGWDRRTIDHPSAVTIHHPEGDEKRISFENDPLSTTSFGGNISPGDGTNLRIADWDVGTTEPGSSGSPLFSPAKRIIGQLQGGFAACGNDDPDWYGRFASSWARGSTQSTRLREWLDPLDTGVTTLDGTSTGAPATPNAPSQLTADPISASEIELSWKDNSNNETDFLVQISEDGANFSLLSTVSANSTAAIAQDLESGKTYSFRVQARNGAGTSGFSNVAEATTAQAVPAMPTNLKATAISMSEIQLSWKDNANDEVDFLIEISQNGTTFSPLLTATQNAQFATVTNLQSLTQYYFRVKARNASGNSAPSNVATALTFGPGGQQCVPNNNTLCLSEGRFRVFVDWATDDDSGVGTAVPLTADTGYFWFFNQANVELVIKVLNACSFADRFWVFAGGLTNVEVEITVVDAVTGAVRQYSNPPETPFQPIQDTDAFATCP